MNRRSILIALAVLVPLALFVPAKIAASWRPVAIGKRNFPPTKEPMLVRVSERYLVVSANYRIDRFDLQTGAHTVLTHGGIAEDDDWITNLRAPKYGQVELALGRDSQTFAFHRKGASVVGEADYSAEVTTRLLSRQVLRIEPDRVQLVFLSTCYRWNRGSRKLEGKTHLGDSTRRVNGLTEERIAALTRDGERVITLDSRGIEWRSALDGQLMKRLPLTGYRPSSDTSSQIQVSNYGQFALYNLRDGGGNTSRNWALHDAETGRVLWKFAMPSTNNRAVFSSDEQRLAVTTADGRWQIRDARTGAIIRTLSRVPNTSGAAFSPDGATLYSVANGVLYRQRAR